ncbi:MAG: FAD-dependent monooxygenase, partial [Alphaproteobacteria bacterium]
MTELPIIIAGGGIGGFAAALALSLKGRPVKLIEQTSEFAEVGAGIQLGPNIMRMFDALGVTDTINAAAVFPDMLVMRDALSADYLVEIPLGPAFEKRFGRPYGVIFRPDLHNALIDAAKASPLVETITGEKVTSYREDGDLVVVETESGQRHWGAALIGADGLWSSIREQLVGDGEPRVAGHIAYRAVLPIDQVPGHIAQERVTLWAGPKTHLVTYPLRRGETFNIVAVFHSDRYEQGWDVYGDPGELNERFDGQHQDVLAMIERIESWRMWVLADRDPISDWSQGRVTLLGDAAHPTLQYMAQGANMAVEDAVCLANLVDAHGSDLAAAFAEY